MGYGNLAERKNKDVTSLNFYSLTR
uniref:Uncharacterized protein n=1 Tax=Arundo donax TaxID=35708 RepID=A0A0A8YC32_ARUDO